LEILRNLTEHVKLFEPLFPAIGYLEVCPHLKANKCDIDEFFDASIFLESLKETTVLNILALDLIKKIDWLARLGIQCQTTGGFLHRELKVEYIVLFLARFKTRTELLMNLLDGFTCDVLRLVMDGLQLGLRA